MNFPAHKRDFVVSHFLVVRVQCSTFTLKLSGISRFLLYYFTFILSELHVFEFKQLI